MPRSTTEYSQIQKRAASRRMAARRAQQSERGFDVIEQACELAFRTCVLRFSKLLNTLARLQVRRLLSTFESWLLMNIVALCTSLAAVAARAQAERRSFITLQLAQRPRQLRPNVHAGVEPGVHLSF